MITDLMKKTPRRDCVLMEWDIHFTDGDVFEQDREYPNNQSTLLKKREIIIKECIEVYAYNLRGIEFFIWDGTKLNRLKTYDVAEDEEFMTKYRRWKLTGLWD